MTVQQNDYLNQVEQEQARVQQELKARRRAPANAAPAALAKAAGGSADFESPVSQSGPPRPPDYRITGLWFWKAVVVQPSVYVVHTRRGHEQPIHMGLGVSFRYNTYRDAFLIIPAAVQTLLINARCICAERQGILVQGYVQWIIDDIGTAYRKLDFSDPEDPMRIVNVQLREQAEAAIKDKVATMSVDAVLSDKQPIIDELTHRLRMVAEGSREGNGTSGLGLKIVTVQIKEAVVSSTRLWENLQKPFRADREKLARMAELKAQEEVVSQELANREVRERAQMEVERQLLLVRDAQERETYDRGQAEKARRHQVEQEAEQRAIGERTATDKAKREAELALALHQMELEARRIAQELEAVRREAELDRVKAERERARSAAAVEVENLVHEGEAGRAERDLGLFQLRRRAENELSEGHVQSQLIARLPEIAASLPKPEELRAISIGPNSGVAGSLVGFLASVLEVADGLRKGRGQTNGVKDP
jgi:flotillin